VCWDIVAGQDLARIFKYLSENASEDVARKLKKSIVTAVDGLRKNPGRFPLEKQLLHTGKQFRFIKVGAYKITYLFTGTESIVLRIYHTKRDPSKILKDLK
ncbi:MAG: type II toxin-antitoxin system RelE/ParE family toxin, partial [Saprospiraceae bacterium]|nr:type II toxin-antitoxin system RelE/ParE family toxin [Saprospiraceae bacterium]